MKVEIMEAYFDLDAEEFVAHLLENYSKKLTGEEIKFIKDYYQDLKEDIDGEFYDSEEQEQILNVIFGFFGISDEDWD